MLSVSPGMERNGLSGGLEDDPSGGGGVGGVGNGGEGATDSIQEVMVAAARDRAIRAGSVRQDLALDLPPRLQLPDGEERPYGAHTALHLRDPEQVSSLSLLFPLFEYLTGYPLLYSLFLGCKWLLEAGQTELGCLASLRYVLFAFARLLEERFVEELNVV